jgi:hypothetical protein
MELIDLIRVAGITVFFSLLWAGSIAFTYWDLHHRSPAGSKSTLWLLVVVLLPLVGFGIYLFAKILSMVLPSGQRETPPRAKRVTALKRPAAQRSSTSTILAADLTTDTILNREDVAPVSNRLKSSLRYIFTVTSGSDLGKEFTIGSFPVYIGRDSDSLILLSGDLGISRKHAEIYERDGTIRIRDLKSTHGTQVNGQRIDDKNLVSGDRIQVGRTVLVVKADGG